MSTCVNVYVRGQKAMRFFAVKICKQFAKKGS